MNNKDWLKLWKEERNEAIRSLDVEKAKAFFEKWAKRGVYDIRLLPSDRVLEISLYKMLYNLKSATEEEKAKAKEWLEERGCTTSM